MEIQSPHRSPKSPSSSPASKPCSASTTHWVATREDRNVTEPLRSRRQPWMLTMALRPGPCVKGQRDGRWKF